MVCHDQVVEVIPEGVPQLLGFVPGVDLPLLHAQDDADGALGHAAHGDGPEGQGHGLRVLLVLREEDPMLHVVVRFGTPVRKAAEHTATHHAVAHTDDGAATENDHPDAVGEHHHAGHQGEHGEDLLRIRAREHDQQDGQAEDEDGGDAAAEQCPDGVQPLREQRELLPPEHRQGPVQAGRAGAAIGVAAAAGRLQGLVHRLGRQGQADRDGDGHDDGDHDRRPAHAAEHEERAEAHVRHLIPHDTAVVDVGHQACRVPPPDVHPCLVLAPNGGPGGGHGWI
mmetsp:Transcript_64130/g.187657  ORF Transcript_64130/g.187657 Transcript_64130/m.187657 type:complete len:282 (-) Transcript_64130:112-957(-)